jgi:hypothetical protein
MGLVPRPRDALLPLPYGRGSVTGRCRYRKETDFTVEGLDTKLGYCDRVVAYADIPGFRRLVLQSRDDAERTIRRLDAAIQNTLRCLALDAGSDWFSVKLFSDCFCISCNESDLITLFMEMSFLQWNRVGVP